MAKTDTVGGHAQGLLTTARTDTWWIEPLWTGLGFLSFVLYSTWAAFQAKFYYADPYLSPFYSPLIFAVPNVPGGAPVEHALLGAWPSWWPAWLPASPAFLILAGPLSFRLTCYYYRKFYYRAYFMSPPGCAVGGLPQKNYKGETMLFLFQNLHRYTLYVAILVIGVLFYDAVLAFFKDGKFGIGVGSIILLMNPILLGSYTFGCHAFRHIIGGHADCFSCPNGNPNLRYKTWKRVTWLNERHMLCAWISLLWVGFTDVYVRLVSMGIIHDCNTWK
jgi:hypothetical protein